MRKQRKGGTPLFGTQGRKTARAIDVRAVRLAERMIQGFPYIEVRHSVFDTAYFTKKRYRKVTIWARVQSALGLKVVSVVPLVTPLATAHMTASP